MDPWGHQILESSDTDLKIIFIMFKERKDKVEKFGRELKFLKTEPNRNSITEKYRWKLRTQLIYSATSYYTWRENSELEERSEENIQKEICKNARMENSGKVRDKEDMVRTSNICIIGVLGGEESKNEQKQCSMR